MIGSVSKFKMLTWSNRIRKFYEDNLKCPIEGQIDLEFKTIVQILYFFGFIGGYGQPHRTKQRAVYGVLSCVLTALTVQLGMCGGFFEALSERDVAKSMMLGAGTVFVAPVIVLILTMLRKPSEITSQIIELNGLHLKYDVNSAMSVISKKCGIMLKAYAFVLTLLAAAYVIAKVSGHGLFVLVIPAIYDKLANGYAHFIWMLVNIVHSLCYGSLVLVSDLLPIFCMVRIAANMKLLGREVRKSADNFHFRVNEEALSECIDYHCKIIE